MKTRCQVAQQTELAAATAETPPPLDSETQTWEEYCEALHNFLFLR